MAVWLWNLSEPLPAAIVVRPTSYEESIMQERDPSFYKIGGNVDQCFWVDELDENLIPEVRRELMQDGKECLQKRKDARKFLLENWDAKQLSYLIVGYGHIFIEYRDGWQITVRSNTCAASHSYPNFGGCISESIAYGLEWRKAKDEERGYRIGETYLAFTDKDGHEISAF